MFSYEEAALGAGPRLDGPDDGQIGGQIAEASRPAELYRGTSFIRNSHPVGPYRRTMPRILRRS